jgi:hypothetical protein
MGSRRSNSSSGSSSKFQPMAEQLDPTSQQVANQLQDADNALAEAQRIFAEETTAEHREQWSNVYRLESATKLSQSILAIADPRITRPEASTELVGSAEQARDAIRAAVDSGGGDLIGSANRLLAASSQIEPGPVPPDVARKLDEIRAEIESTRSKIEAQISDAGTEVADKKERAFASIGEAVDAVNTRREAAEQQASELGLTTSAIAAENLANAYAEVVRKTERQAKRYTWGSLLTYLFSILVAGVGIYTTAQHTSEVETFVARAALGIPFALFGTYINSLASNHRREAWRLRHIELQIRTANPFLGLLDSERREETLAALAIRFFPGQEGVSFDGERNAELTPEVITLLRQLLVQQGSAATPGPSKPAGSQTAPQQAAP